jgi:hypothetical protein
MLLCHSRTAHSTPDVTELRFALVSALFRCCSWLGIMEIDELEVVLPDLQQDCVHHIIKGLDWYELQRVFGAIPRIAAPNPHAVGT